MIRTALKRTGPPKRKAPLRRVNTERRAGKHSRNFDGGGLDHDGWVRARPCCICARLGKRQETPTQAAHVIARGMGGCNSGWWLIVGLCNDHHRMQEITGNGYLLDSYGVDLREVARALVREHLEELGCI